MIAGLPERVGEDFPRLPEAASDGVDGLVDFVKHFVVGKPPEVWVRDRVSPEGESGGLHFRELRPGHGPHLVSGCPEQVAHPLAHLSSSVKEAGGQEEGRRQVVAEQRGHGVGVVVLVTVVEGYGDGGLGVGGGTGDPADLGQGDHSTVIGEPGQMLVEELGAGGCEARLSTDGVVAENYHPAGLRPDRSELR